MSRKALKGNKNVIIEHVIFSLDLPHKIGDIPRFPYLISSKDSLVCILPKWTTHKIHPLLIKVFTYSRKQASYWKEHKPARILTPFTPCKNSPTELNPPNTLQTQGTSQFCFPSPITAVQKQKASKASSAERYQQKGERWKRTPSHREKTSKQKTPSVTWSTAAWQPITESFSGKQLLQQHMGIQLAAVSMKSFEKYESSEIAGVLLSLTRTKKGSGNKRAAGEWRYLCHASTKSLHRQEHKHMAKDPSGLTLPKLLERSLLFWFFFIYTFRIVLQNPNRIPLLSHKLPNKSEKHFRESAWTVQTSTQAAHRNPKLRPFHSTLPELQSLIPPTK